jgi:phage terminase large subunit-like protein/RNA polymerase subunit RPABC4/transcription elongation factor Spt4
MPQQIRPWYNIARPKQLPPDHPDHLKADRNGYYCRWIDKDGHEHKCQGQDDWYIWLLLAGRGAGKTLSGSNWILEQALTYPNTRWAIVAPTYGQVQKVCIKGDSGVYAQALPGEILEYNKNELVISLANGSEIHGFSAENPERARGFNLSGAWLDEVGSYRGTELWDEVLQPALRKGDPKVVVTTTPSASPLLKRWYDLFINESKAGRPCDVHLTHSTFRENYSLPPKRVEALEKEYAGTRAGRQELEGEMLEDFEGALWKREYIENSRVRPEDFHIENMTRIVVAVDPSMTSGEKADDSGIIVAAMDNNKDGFLIADLSCHGSPDRVMREAVAAYYKYSADCVVMEANQGGDYLTAALRAVDPGVPPRIVRAQKGKLIRAQPISMLAEQGRLHHVGYFPELEDQLCLAGGTKITVPEGTIPIEAVIPGDHVLTRKGWRPVLAAGCTGLRQTIKVKTGIGDLVCTPDHPVYVENIGWIEADLLRAGDILVTCHDGSSDLTLNSTGKNISLTTPDITGQVALGEDGSCTVISGNIPTGLSPKDIISTIRTTTKATTDLTISLRSPLLNMSAPMAYEEHGHSPENRKQRWPATSGSDEKKLVHFQQGNLAWNAEQKYSHTVPILQSTVVENVQSEQNTVEPVYDLTIDDAHEFFANGVLVHNCVMTPDNKRDHDDRADAFVWAFSELRGITEGSYLDAYGYKRCETCQYTYNKSHGQCPQCGNKNQPEKATAPGDWAKAYNITCRKCGKVYPPKEPSCPSCSPGPGTYLSRVAALSGQSANWIQYRPR